MPTKKLSIAEATKIYDAASDIKSDSTIVHPLTPHDHIWQFIGQVETDLDGWEHGLAQCVTCLQTIERWNIPQKLEGVANDLKTALTDVSNLIEGIENGR